MYQGPLRYIYNMKNNFHTDNKKRILYIYPYFSLDSKKGAEQLDILAGIEILKKVNNIDIATITIDLKNKTIISDINYPENRISISIIFSYIKFSVIKYTTFDNAMRQAFTYRNYSLVKNIVRSNKIDIIITNTTSTVLFGINQKAKHFFRSVCYEPIYVFGAVNGRITTRIHSFLKYLSVHKELRSDVLFAISPRDAIYYKKHFKYIKRKPILEVLPLRQFHRILPLKTYNKNSTRLNIGFLGSTYNVLHNKKSLDFIVNDVANNLKNIEGVVFNIYGSKLPNVKSVYHNIVNHNWVESIEEIYSYNDVFLAPNFLPSGMQSKVFEPMLFGKVLICDTESLSGFNFITNVEYLHAASATEFANKIIWVKENIEESKKLALFGYKKAFEIIGPSAIQKQLEFINPKP